MVEKLLLAIFIYVITVGSGILIAIYGLKKKLDDIFDLIDEDIFNRRMEWR